MFYLTTLVSQLNMPLFSEDLLEIAINEHAKDGPSTFPTNYSLIRKFVNWYNQPHVADRITSILSNKIGLIKRTSSSDFLDEILLDYEIEFSLIDQVIREPRDAIFILIKSIDLDNFKLCARDEQIDFVSVPSQIIYPPEFQFGNIRYDHGERRAIATRYRYVNNFDVKSAKDKIDKILPVDLTNPSVKDYEREANLYNQYINKVLNQTRSINIARMCFSAILISRVGGKNKYIHDCCNEYNPSLYYMRKLMDRFTKWPFIENTTGMMFTNQVGISSQLPLLLYAILNRSISWNLGVITTGYFNLCMHTYFEWSATSFDDNHLLQKGNMNAVRKLLHERVKADECVLTYDNVGISGITKLEGPISEYWIDDEKARLLKMTKSSTTTKYYSQIQLLLTRSFSINELLAHKMALACCTNPSTYKKSTPTLEYDRSAEHKVHQPVRIRYARLRYNDFPVEPRYDPNSQIGRCWIKLLEHTPAVRKDLSNRDFEAEFWDRLTNNSAGIVMDTIQEKRQTNELLKAMRNIPYGQRYISALVDNEILYNKVQAMDALSQRIKAGKREQIDRRSRWIMMVANTLQAAFSVALSYGRALTKDTTFIASGKQSGDLRDMLQVLRSSSNENTIITDNDIRGMDSSTQEQIADMILHVVFASLDGLKVDEFFYAKSQTVVCTVHDQHGYVIGTETRELNAVQVFMTDIIGRMRPGEYELPEGWVQDVVYIAGSVFWSGAFHTAVQHNTLLCSVLEVLFDEVTTAYSKFGATFNGSILGDDISLEIKFSKSGPEIDSTATTIIKRLQTILRELGFEADPESSRFQSTFLQQTAVFGKVEPKHARLSLVTSERGDGREKDPFNQIKEIGDILDEMASRSHVPENAIAVLHSLWLVCRTVKLNKRKHRITLGNLCKFRRWIKDNGEYIGLTIPFTSIFLPEVFGSTPPPMHTFDNGTLNPGYYAPKGSFFYWLIAKAFIHHPHSKVTKDLVERYNYNYCAKLKKLFENDRISEGKYRLASTIQYQVPYYELLDHEKLWCTGLTFGQWLYATLPKKRMVEEKELDNPIFGKLVSIGKSKQNQNSAYSAYLAKQRLLNSGVRISDSLAYYNQPLNRIKQAFSQRKSIAMNGLHDNRVMDRLKVFIERANSSTPKFIISKDHTIDYDIELTDQDIELSSESAIISNTDFGPCCYRDSEAWHLTLIFGTPFGTPSVDSILNAFKDELSAGADIELILSKAAIINNTDPRLLDDFFIFLGLPRHQYSSFKRLVDEFSSYSLVHYQGILNKRKHFFSNTLTAGSRRLFIPTNSSYLKNKWNKLQFVISRDYFYAFPGVNRKLRITPRFGLTLGKV